MMPPPVQEEIRATYPFLEYGALFAKATFTDSR